MFLQKHSYRENLGLEKLFCIQIFSYYWFFFLNNDIVNNQLTKFNKKIVSWKSRIFALRNIAQTVLFMRNTGQPELIYRLLGYFFVLILTWEILPVF